MDLLELKKQKISKAEANLFHIAVCRRMLNKKGIQSAEWHKSIHTEKELEFVLTKKGIANIDLHFKKDAKGKNTQKIDLIKTLKDEENQNQIVVLHNPTEKNINETEKK